MKQLLAAQELLFPRIYHSLQTAMKPLMKREIKDEEEDRSSEHNNNDMSV